MRFSIKFRKPLLLIAIGVLGGCASRPAAEPLNLDWEFRDVPGKPTRACLSAEDVAKIRELLLRCQAFQK